MQARYVTRRFSGVRDAREKQNAPGLPLDSGFLFALALTVVHTKRGKSGAPYAVGRSDVALSGSVRQRSALSSDLAPSDVRRVPSPTRSGDRLRRKFAGASQAPMRVGGASLSLADWLCRRYARIEVLWARKRVAAAPSFREAPRVALTRNLPRKSRVR